LHLFIPLAQRTLQEMVFGAQSRAAQVPVTAMAMAMRSEKKHIPIINDIGQVRKPLDKHDCQ